MVEGPQYSFNRHPRFSANQLADYLCTTNATQREAVIRKAKFPRAIQAASYQQAVPAIRKAFTFNGGAGAVEEAIQRMRLKAERETSYTRDEALRCVEALERFKELFVGAKFGKIRFQSSPQNVSLKIDGVSVNARLEPPLIEEVDKDTIRNGGIVVFLAGSAEARKNIEERTKHVASIIYWALQSSGGNVEPLPRLCMSLDVFGGTITKAPTSFERMRSRMAASCREVRDCWDRIDPPSGYDGPDWH